VAARSYEGSTFGRDVALDWALDAALAAEVGASFARDVLEPLLRAVAASTKTGGKVEIRGECAEPNLVLRLRGVPLAAPLPPEAPPWKLESARERELAIACRRVRSYGGSVVRLASVDAVSLRVTLPVARREDPVRSP
jgi:hypothetical protein